MSGCSTLDYVVFMRALGFGLSGRLKDHRDKAEENAAHRRALRESLREWSASHQDDVTRFMNLVLPGGADYQSFSHPAQNHTATHIVPPVRALAQDVLQRQVDSVSSRGHMCLPKQALNQLFVSSVVLFVVRLALRGSPFEGF